MEKETSIQEELKETGVQLPPRPSFDSPSGYFESFPDTMMSRWKKEGTASGLKVRRFHKVIAAAAIIICAVFGTYFLFIHSPGTASTPLTAAEAYAFIYEHIDEFEAQLEEEVIEKEGEANYDPVLEEILLEEMDAADIEALFF